MIGVKILKKHLCYFTEVKRRILKKREKRRIFSKLKYKEKRGGLIVKIKSKSNTKRLSIVAPKILGFYGERSRIDIMLWLKKLREMTIRNKVFIDFSQSKNTESSGIIRILAEIDRLQQIYGRNRILGNAPLDNIAAQALEKIGLLEMIRSFKRPHVSHKEVIYWNYISGTNIDAEKSGKMLETLLDIDNNNEDIMDSLFNGLTEAMTNVVMHAYDSPIKTWNENEKKWWMFAGVKEGNLVLIICDIGVGIPVSIPTKHKGGIIKNIISSLSDFIIEGEIIKESKLIKVAMEIGRSSSNKLHRGLGMAQLKTLIDIMSEGKLFIHSNAGRYYYSYNSSQSSKEQLKDSSISIEGTIIGWQVPISQLKLIAKGNLS